jgi:predicted nucleic acid-binding protein
MIVVDSSVWIDWFRTAATDETRKLAACDPDEILVGDTVLLEILRGATDGRQAQKLETRLREYEIAKMLDAPLASKGAMNYRLLRSRGFTIRSIADLIIATYCIENDHVLLQRDRDFAPMAEHLGLRLA